MEKIIEMEYPNVPNVTIFDGQIHRIRATNLYYLFERNGQTIYLLRYYDYNLGQYMETIIEEYNNSFYKRPLNDYDSVDYGRFYDDGLNNGFQCDINILPLHINTRPVASVKDLIELKSSTKYNVVTPQKVAEARAKIIVYFDNAGHKFLDEAAAKAVGMTGNWIKYLPIIDNSRPPYHHLTQKEYKILVSMFDIYPVDVKDVDIYTGEQFFGEGKIVNYLPLSVAKAIYDIYDPNFWKNNGLVFYLTSENGVTEGMYYQISEQEVQSIKSSYSLNLKPIIGTKRTVKVYYDQYGNNYLDISNVKRLLGDKALQVSPTIMHNGEKLIRLSIDEYKNIANKFKVKKEKIVVESTIEMENKPKPNKESFVYIDSIINYCFSNNNLTPMYFPNAKLVEVNYRSGGINYNEKLWMFSSFDADVSPLINSASRSTNFWRNIEVRNIDKKRITKITVYRDSNGKKYISKKSLERVSKTNLAMYGEYIPFDGSIENTFYLFCKDTYPVFVEKGYNFLDDEDIMKGGSHR